ncbi:MAG: c-type cytochrome [Bacteroidota bacterium]
MSVNFLLLLLVLLIAVFFGWLTRRAFSARNPFVKWIGSILAGLLTLLVGLFAVVSGIGIFKYYTVPARPIPDIKVEGTPEQIARGEHLAGAFCAGCHSTTGDLPLTGGMDMGADLPMPLGKYVSANLTPAGPLKDWTDGEIFRAIRANVDRDGKPLTFMSTVNVRYLSDDDIKALIAYLRNQQPVENEVPAPYDRPTLLAFFMGGANLLPSPPPVEGPVAGPAMAPTADYGKFMLTFLDCKICHGADLNGGTNPATPKGPSLRLVKGWTVQQFMDTLRTGKDPGGHVLSPTMPWKPTGRLSDVELTALYKYIVSLP